MPDDETPPPLPPKVIIISTISFITHVQENAHRHLLCFLCVQPKTRTSSEESMASEDDRTRKSSSLYTPSTLIRTSSGTHARPTPNPRPSRHSGERTHTPTHDVTLQEYRRVLKMCLNVCVCDADPPTLLVQFNENPADLLPPELPPKGPRRWQNQTKVRRRKRRRSTSYYQLQSEQIIYK